jgi:sporulation protein YabP
MRELTDGAPVGRLRTHTMLMENREKVTITGVDDVDNFNEGEVNLMTGAGAITLRGSDLHINKLSLDEGQLVVEGHITGVEYSEPDARGGGFFGRLFR